jgi:1-deoxy-D-xylulose-5-phosphate reductoisomerase
MNAANEVAVSAFLQHRIGFMDIIASIEHALSVMSVGSEISLESVLDANDKAMAVTRSWIAKKGK